MVDPPFSVVRPTCIRVKTCGPANEGFVRGLGADEVLDYKITDLKEWVGAEEGGD